MLDTRHKIAVTGHTTDGIISTLEKYNIEIKEFKEILYNYIKNHFLSANVIFHLGGSDGMDNLVGEVLLKLKNEDIEIPYKLFLAEEDRNYRDYWDNDEIELIEKLKKNAEEIIWVDGYLSRNKAMIEGVEDLLMFLNNEWIDNSGTGYTFKKFLKNTLEKESDIEIINLDINIPSFRRVITKY